MTPIPSSGTRLTTTYDKVFLPGYLEENYWKDYKSAEATAYALNKFPLSSNETKKKWMLRNMYCDSAKSTTYRVSVIPSSNKTYDDSIVMGIRPMMWVKLNTAE